MNTIKVYTIEQICEADYGCEETGRTEPMAVLKMYSDDEYKEFEVSERELGKKGIFEGKKVCFTGSGEILKYIRVVAAVIKEKDKIFATARGYGEYKGWWEFPGGKIEPGETAQQALIREIKEELTAEIKVGDLIKTEEYDYPTFHLSMDCFWAEVVNGNIVLKEAEAARWLKKTELDDVNWLPADADLIETIKDCW